jgi:uncharacterized membrane protein (UPF0182 family)
MPTFEARAELDPRAVRRFAMRIGVIVIFLIALFQSISIYVENLWFQSVGYSAVYWYQLRAQGSTFLAFGVASGIMVWILFRLVMPSGSRPRGSLIRFGNEQINVPSPDSFKKFALPVAAILASVRSRLQRRLEHYALSNRPAASGVVDPIFGQPFRSLYTSLLEAVAGWFLTIAFTPPRLLPITDATGKFKGVSIALGVLLLAIAVETYVYRYSLILAANNLITGVGYVDDHVVLPGLWFVIAALVAGALIPFSNVRSGLARNFIAALALPLATYMVAGVLIPGYVATFVVRPNEFVKERHTSRTISNSRGRLSAGSRGRDSFVPETNTVFDPAHGRPSTTSGSGTGVHCRRLFVRFRRFEPTTTSRMWTSTGTPLTAVLDR